jgi:2'-5' RNA ligase
MTMTEQRNDNSLSEGRLFLGLQPPAECARYWLETARGTLGCPSWLRWQLPANVHLTVHFLGRIGAVTVSRLVPAMAAAMAGHGPVQVETGSGAWFPDAQRPVVLVASVRLQPSLVALATAVEQVVEEIGLPVDPRPFQPHITLARLRGRPRAWPPALSLAPKEFTATQLVLFESQSDSTGTRYLPRHVFSMV